MSEQKARRVNHEPLSIVIARAKSTGAGRRLVGGEWIFSKDELVRFHDLLIAVGMSEAATLCEGEARKYMDGWESAAFALAEVVLEKGDYNWTPEEWHRQMLAAWKPNEPQGWQPIETAPRNGDVILLLATGPAMNRASTGHYSVEPYVTMQGEVVGAEEGFKSDGDQCIPSNQEVFTHWMPLPSAPVTKGETP